jgi:hypothetical protein
VDVNRERVQLWVEALESGEFEQGSGQLQIRLSLNDKGETTDKATYCCLGVAIEVALRNGYTPQLVQGIVNPYMESYEHLNTALWPGVVAWYGFEKTEQDPYIGIWHNDDGEYRTKNPGDTFEWESLSASDANDEHHLNFQQIAAGLRAKYLGEDITFPDGEGDRR